MESDELERLAESRWLYRRQPGCRVEPVLLRPGKNEKPQDYYTLDRLNGPPCGQSWNVAAAGAREAWRHTTEMATVGVTHHRKPARGQDRATGGHDVHPHVRRVSDEDWARIVKARAKVRAARVEQARVEAEAFENGEPMAVGCRMD